MTEEREMLRRTVAALVDRHAPPDAVRRAMSSDRGYDESLWALLCEQVGATALVVPEEFGGAGGELADAAVVFEELGRALVPTPLLGTTLAEMALLAADAPDAAALERLAGGGVVGALVFDPDHVVHGDVADIVVAVRQGRIERWTQVVAEPLTPLDPTRRLARLCPDRTEVIENWLADNDSYGVAVVGLTSARLPSGHKLDVEPNSDQTLVAASLVSTYFATSWAPEGVL